MWPETRAAAVCPPRATRRGLVLRLGHRRDVDAFVPDGSSPTLPDGRGRFWTAFRGCYPGARRLLPASRVGVSADGRRALVWLESSCGEPCGGGAYVVLARGPFSQWPAAPGPGRRRPYRFVTRIYLVKLLRMDRHG